MSPGHSILVTGGAGYIGSHTVLQLVARGERVTLTSQPSEGPIGKLLRSALSSKDAFESRHSRCWLQMAFSADKYWHIDNVISPAIARGEIVISDRYVASTYAYADASADTSGGGALAPFWLNGLNTYVLHPDVTVFLQATVGECSARIAGRGDQW